MRKNLSVSPALLLSVSLLLAGCETASPPAASPPVPSVPAVTSVRSTPTAAATPLQDLDYSGDQSALVALDRDLAAAGTDAKKLAALEKRLVDLLKRTDGTIAARQAACQRLGFVLAASGGAPDAATLKLLGVMLADPRESDIARLALAPVSGAAIDKLFVDALGTTSGATRRGIIVSLEQRKPSTAVAPLRALLSDGDAPTVAAAATALGQIGGTGALDALRSAHPVVAAAGAVTEAKLHLARSLPTAEGVAVFNEIFRDTTQPAYRRATALRGLLDLEPASAATRIAEVLAGKEWTAKEAAIESIYESKAPGLVAALAAKVSSWDAPTQAAALAAFGRRGDAAATAALVAGTKHTNADVRAAAITALGRVPGDAALAATLAQLATGENSADAKLARASLARLNGPGVSEAVLAGAKDGKAASRALFIDLMAQRNLTDALPMLRAMRQESDATVRAAAVAAVGDLGTTADQALVLDWAAAATDSIEQTRAMRALVNLTLRDPDTVKRAAPIYAFLEKAPPAVATRLMPVLTRLGGKESADCAARLALSSDAATAEAAAGVLSRWPDRAAQPALINVASKAPVAAVRTSALQGALRYLERNREPWSAEQAAQISSLLAATTDPALRKRLVVLLNRANDAASLALVEKLSAEPALAEVAKDAAACIAANRAGPPTARASGDESAARNLVDGRVATQWRVMAIPDQWVEIDFKAPRPLHRITLDQTGRIGDYPEHYEVFATDDPAKPGKAIASGAGQRLRTVIDLPAGTRARYVIVKNTAERIDGMWAICEFFVE